MENEIVSKLQVIFDNGGGIHVQDGENSYSYDNPQDAAFDALEMLFGATGGDWESPGPLIVPTGEEIRNGGYVVWDRDDVWAAYVGEPGTVYDAWENIRAFRAAIEEL